MSVIVFVVFVDHCYVFFFCLVLFCLNPWKMSFHVILTSHWTDFFFQLMLEFIVNRSRNSHPKWRKTVQSLNGVHISRDFIWLLFVILLIPFVISFFLFLFLFHCYVSVICFGYYTWKWWRKFLQLYLKKVKSAIWPKVSVQVRNRVLKHRNHLFLFLFFVMVDLGC